MSQGSATKFHYHNDGSSGAIVYPKVLNVDGSTHWDGRKVRGFRWEMTTGESVTVDLVNDAGCTDGNSYCAGFNVVAGSDRKDLSDSFTAASGSYTARWNYYGPVNNGTCQYEGFSTTDADLAKIIEAEKQKLKTH